MGIIVGAKGSGGVVGMPTTSQQNPTIKTGIIENPVSQADSWADKYKTLSVGQINGSYGLVTSVNSEPTIIDEPKNSNKNSFVVIIILVIIAYLFKK